MSDDQALPPDPPADLTGPPPAPEAFDPEALRGKLRYFTGGRDKKPPPPADEPPPVAEPAKLTKQETRVLRQERRRQAYDMRLKDLSFDAIGKQLGISGKTAYHYVRTYALTINGPKDQSVQMKRMRASAKFARIQQELWAVIDNVKTGTKDKIEALKTLVAATREQGLLEGTYMPIKLAATTPDGEQWAPLALALTKLSAEEIVALEKLATVRLLPASIEGELVMAGGER